MVVGAIAAFQALFMPVSDEYTARFDAAKAAWESCMRSNARSMDDGSDIEVVGERVARSCAGAYATFLSATVPMASPDVTARVLASQRSTMHDVAVMLVRDARAERHHN
jgi:hypothetical protein